MLKRQTAFQQRKSQSDEFQINHSDGNVVKEGIQRDRMKTLFTQIMYNFVASIAKTNIWDDWFFFRLLEHQQHNARYDHK